ncbi:NAD-dependent succinate-semialdehyde dehydrogenase [Rhodovibrio salinarum]|uniref:NAD-dependent succinate-semialdehyde dehydrogenase n=1 Tax=Rhodovibrio salinarum TaxID=1087 RepID=A0A934QLC4_9PROT|nr:NAD-dependent succinate-semialdehyde dehydrogenase [Rhodovibrio salinarum]MBK1698867.1 NAD-dependent succinate-semialdehyde dehydrogenase [Rhodovibrio salinarum]
MTNPSNLPAGSPLANIGDQKLVRDQSYIAGEWRSGADGQHVDVTNPADGQVIGRVSALSAAESRSAVDAAEAAFASWSELLPQERSRLMRRWFDLMMANKEDLAQLMMLEQGKPISEARGEIDYAASFIEYYAEEAKRPNSENVTSHLPDAEMEVWREPIGICALITPWNFPSAMLTRKAAAAMAAGCPVVAHPSKETPFSATALAELAERAGIPAGIFNVVTGEARTVCPPWTEDTRVRALSFTGSTEVGRLLYSQCAPTVKKLVMELGGHAPVLVFADAELDDAVTESVKAKFATSGQDCLGANRILVERSIYDEFCKKFAEQTAALTVGPGPEDCDIGPLMNQGAFDKQVEHVEDAKARGAKVLCGGGRHEAGELFFQPTVLADVPSDAKIFQEETFGPVAAIAPFDEESEAITRANATEYGLVAYLHTMNPRRIYRVSRALAFGMVAVNRTKVTGAPIPFGGVKQSGLGREGGRLGMEEFTEVKYVCRDWI